MNNYENTEHKIKNIWNNLEDSKNKYDQLKKESPKIISLNYIENQNEYIIDNFQFSISIIKFYEINLKYFPEDVLPYLKVIPILSTTEGFTDLLINETWESDIRYNILSLYNEETQEYEYKLKIHWLSLSFSYSAGHNYLIDTNLKLFLDIPQDYNELRTEK